MDKIKYLDLSKHIQDCRKDNIPYYMAIGERANGKSYSSKKEIVSYCYKYDKRFVYLRRWKEDVKEMQVINYFEDCPIRDITKGKYNSIIPFRGYLYYANVDKDGNKERGDICGRVMSLAEDARYKSQVFTDYEYILFEEIMPKDGHYLPNEPERLESIISTVFRRRMGYVVMLGNSESRISPYVEYWSLQGLVNQKQDTIEMYELNTAEESVKLALYYTANVASTNRLFSRQNKMTIKGTWRSDSFPCITHAELARAKVIYTLVAEYNYMRFLLRFIRLDGEYMFHVERKTTKIKYGERIVSNIFYPQRKATNDFIPLNKGEERIFSFLNKVVFTDNLTGTDFYQAMQNLKTTRFKNNHIK